MLNIQNILKFLHLYRFVNCGRAVFRWSTIFIHFYYLLADNCRYIILVFKNSRFIQNLTTIFNLFVHYNLSNSLSIERLFLPILHNPNNNYNLSKY